MVLYFVYLTGTLGYLDKEIDYWMTPDRPHFAAPGTQREQLAMAQIHLQQVAPDAERWNIQLIGGREAPALEVSWTDKPQGGPPRGATHRETLDPRTGEPIDYTARATGGGQVLYKMHYQLAYIPYNKAILIIMVCTLVMFAAMVTRHHRAQEHLQGLLHLPAAQGTAQLARWRTTCSASRRCRSTSSSPTAGSCSSPTSSCRPCRIC